MRRSNFILVGKIRKLSHYEQLELLDTVAIVAYLKAFSVYQGAAPAEYAMIGSIDDRHVGESPRDCKNLLHPI